MRTIELGDGVELELDTVGEGRMQVMGIDVLVDVERELDVLGGPIYRAGCSGLPDGRGEAYGSTEAQAVRYALLALARDFGRMRDEYERVRSNVAAFVHGLTPAPVALVDVCAPGDFPVDEDFDEPPTPFCNHGSGDDAAADECPACIGGGR